MASTLELLLLAQLAGPGSPVFAQTDTSSITTGNVTTATAITVPWASLPGTPAIGQVYGLKTEFNGTWGNQLLTFYADIAGTMTSLCTIGAALGASGDTVNGWLDLTVRVVSATACRLHLKGVIVDSTANSGHVLDTSAAPISSTVVTGIAFAGSDTIALACAFGASVTGQTVATLGSTFTRMA